MIYNAIGIMSGSSLDGLDIAFVQFQEKAGIWQFELLNSQCVEYSNGWTEKLRSSPDIPAKEFLLLDNQYGVFIGEKINEFIEANQLHHKVNLIGSHGHTTFHFPEIKMTHQIGAGAAIAATTHLPVVSDLRSLDVAFGGQGAPLVPTGEKLLFPNYHFFLNLGGIANISFNEAGNFKAYDICAANLVLNKLANQKKLMYDKNGDLAAAGKINVELLDKLNSLEYYTKPFPKSLANSFGTEVVYSMIIEANLNTEDALSTYTEHICRQVQHSLSPFFKKDQYQTLLITGGGAFNTYLIQRLKSVLEEINFEIELPSEEVINYKEAIIMALLGVLRWREQITVYSGVTGASKNSIGGALWLGTDA